MKKVDKREMLNLFFSAFLIVAFIVCAHFFNQFANGLTPIAGAVISIALFVVFGLLLFYATRVGDGKAIKRFSVPTLVILVIPSLYIIIASLATGLPFHETFSADDGTLNMVVTLACVALGYGIPYTFLSGFETVDENAVVAVEENAVLEGGIEADIMEETTEEVSEETEEEASEE